MSQMSCSLTVAAAVNGKRVSACVDVTRLLSSISYRFFSTESPLLPRMGTSATPFSPCSVLVASHSGCYLSFSSLAVLACADHDLILGRDWLVGVGLAGETTSILDPSAVNRLLPGFDWVPSSLSKCKYHHEVFLC